MEVRIERPFQLKLDVVAIDQHVPSMKANVSFRVEQFGQKLEYCGSFWFDCASWDSFVAALDSVQNKPARMTDMSGSFVFALQMGTEKIEASWEIKRIALEGAVTTVTCRFPVDLDDLAHMKEKLKDFPRWW
ncbi:hypothetical protein [Cupriavidus gilardii]|uniref:hypothetical protein n=1 Tax=Cupriavidus gilardii TaxID=82541 RepID=UPI0015735A90|nr:hypothetical protein [Cupriavidus gilardii]NSX06947.1 hypothetical protein [Cupriavidus gilardii]